MLAAATTCAVIHGWDPPFPYRAGYTPPRDIVAAVPFTKFDPVATQAAKDRARSQARYVYVQDPEPLVQLRALLRNTLVELTAAAAQKKWEPKLWREFLLPSEQASPPSAKQQREQFRRFCAELTPQESLDRVVNAVADVLAPLEKRGLLDKLPKSLKPGNQEEIVVYAGAKPPSRQIIPVSEVQLRDGAAIQEGLHNKPELSGMADRLFAWLYPRLKQLKSTLRLDDQLTNQEADAAVAAVGDVFTEYAAGQTLAKAGQPLDKEQVDLLRLEYAAAMNQRSAAQSLVRAAAVTALIFAAFLLCGIYMRFRQRGPLVSLTRLIVLLLLAIATVDLAQWASSPGWRGEIAPVLLFGMMMAIVYRQELALLLSGVVVMVVVLGVGHGLQEFALLMGAAAAAVLNLGRIRSRSKIDLCRPVRRRGGHVAAIGLGPHRPAAAQPDAAQRCCARMDCGPWPPDSLPPVCCPSSNISSAC